MGIFFVVLIACVCVFFLWPATSRAGEKTSDAPAITRRAFRSMSRADVEKKLQNIATQKAPIPLMVATCYKVAVAPNRAEYVCPVCGEKTLYTDNTAQFINRNLEKARIEFANLKKVTDLQIELDESSLCKKCHPETLDRTLVLKITYADGSAHEYPKVLPDDLIMLRFFFCDCLTYLDSRNHEESIKPKLPRLRELLGMKDEKVKK